MKKIPAFLSASILGLAMLQGCGGNVNTVADNESRTEVPAPWDLVDEGEAPPPTNHSYDRIIDAVDSTADSAALTEPLPEDSIADDTGDDADKAELPAPDPARMARYRGLGRLNELFNDSNKYQYAAGERIGIKPIHSLGDAYFTRRPLVKIKSCQWYTLEELTHSMPYLVPEAASLLETIGRNFTDSLKKRNASGHRMRVTSVLRSAHSVKKLRRVNRNATDSSTHQLGTTFDISYARFDHDGKSARVSDAELKHILAEVLRDLRAQNKCMVKYEIKSPCFHITATGF